MCPTPVHHYLRMARGGYGVYDSDDDYDIRQQRFAFPWEHSRARRDLIDPESDRFKKYDNPDAFRKAVRRAIHNQDVDGWTRKEKYGDPRTDVGHIFATENGGSDTLGNVYMQERAFNRTIADGADELNAACVGYRQTAKAMTESIKYGNLRKPNGK